jgi:hypothetical protein|tara:strand:+ start:78 stop:329 length:252 start_codon:yes stop_codon:yes gene_type:complete
MLVVRCKCCGKEVVGKGSRPVSCGCPNMVVVKGDSVTANDLSKVVMISSPTNETEKPKLSAADIEWQESRKKRKIRKLNFEIR